MYISEAQDEIANTRRGVVYDDIAAANHQDIGVAMPLDL